LHRARIEQERLEKNKERRKKREKQKKLQQKMRDGGAAGDEGSPEPSTEKITGTTRKCANCGQVGHIKTNKKYVCPCSQKDTAKPRETEGGGRKGNLGPFGILSCSKSSKRDSWRPTSDPREGDRFWDPWTWDTSAFQDKM
jgi:transcription initiation factor TFIID subunit 1